MVSCYVQGPLLLRLVLQIKFPHSDKFYNIIVQESWEQQQQQAASAQAQENCWASEHFSQPPQLTQVKIDKLFIAAIFLSTRTYLFYQ